MLSVLALAVLAATAAAYVVPGQLTASFTVSPSKAYVNHAVTFDGSSSTAQNGDTIASYQWTFGDGASTTTTTPTVTHIYPATGSYQVTLVVVDPSGNTSLPDTIALKVRADAPVAKFKRIHKTVKTGQTDTFDGSASYDPAGDPIVSYEWGFGDGTGQTTTIPLVQHAYGLAGIYKVTLTVVDSRGLTSATVTHSVTVKAPPGPTTPTARFVVQPRRAIVGQSVSFDGSSSSAVPGRTLVAYEWDFGDGARQVTGSPLVSHTYTRSGDFIAQLVVVDSKGKHSTAAVKLVHVAGSPRVFGVHARVCRHRGRGCPHAGVAVRFTLTTPGQAVLTVRHRGRLLAQRVIHGHAGRIHTFIRFRGVARRRYTLSVTPAGGRTVQVRFRWRR